MLISLFLLSLFQFKYRHTGYTV